MIPGIGTLSAIQSGGRLGVVLGAQAVGPESDGKQLVSLRLKAVDGRDSRGFAVDPAPSPSQQPVPPGKAVAAPATQGARAPTAAKLSGDLSPAEKQEVARLQQRDAQVRQEENAHAANAGTLAGPISYVYQIGPDGRQYAVGGSVPISAAAVTGDPAELRRIGARLEAAALAAVNPSAQDLSAARAGVRLYAEAVGLAKPGLDISV